MAEYDYNAADTWMCRCGKTSTGKFCVKCGTGNSRRSLTSQVAESKAEQENAVQETVEKTADESAG